ncbi:MAG: hypothetical protein LBV71_00945 [Prevotella sp.]|jgi:hypothetical protein|nr:hypothetical protein [Prevotella sp.]
MIIRYIEHELALHDFKKEEKNTSCVYNKIVGNVELICFIERNMKLYFISIYRWNNNRLRGSYKITSSELKNCPDFASTLFKKTIDNVPRFIGDKIDIHVEIVKAIDETFNL